MEEKERYEWNSRFDEAIKDNQTGDIVNAVEVLNKQDKRIKELEQENQQLKQQLLLTEKALELACKEITGSCEYCSYKTRVECPVEANCLDEKINYFKTKAKEMMKSE